MLCLSIYTQANSYFASLYSFIVSLSVIAPSLTKADCVSLHDPLHGSSIARVSPFYPEGNPTMEERDHQVAKTESCVAFPDSNATKSRDDSTRTYLSIGTSPLRTLSRAQSTQTDEGDELELKSDSLTQLENRSSMEVMHLERKLEALTISNELLQTSLDDAKRQISSLEKTIASQKEELQSKEEQAAAINKRVGTLLKSIEVCHKGRGNL